MAVGVRVCVRVCVASAAIEFDTTRSTTWLVASAGAFLTDALLYNSLGKIVRVVIAFSAEVGTRRDVALVSEWGSRLGQEVPGYCAGCLRSGAVTDTAY